MAEIEISIDQEICIRCGECIASCPGKVYSKDDSGNIIVSKPDNCRRCFGCMHLCPADAITIKEKKVGIEISLD